MEFVSHKIHSKKLQNQLNTSNKDLLKCPHPFIFPEFEPILLCATIQGQAGKDTLMDTIFSWLAFFVFYISR